MIKSVTLSLLLLLISGFGFSQNRQDRRDELEAQKRAYMTEKLDLTVEEAEKFWPLYNEYQDKRDKLRQERRNLRPSKPYSELSDQEIEEFVQKTFDIKQKELDLEKSYYDKFKVVITIPKAAKIHIVEEQFKKYILKQLREERRGRSRR